MKNKTKKTILLIGGTGIIGKAVIKEALDRGYTVTSLSIDREKNFDTRVNQIIVDRRTNEFLTVIKSLNQTWDIVFDIFSYDNQDAKKTYTALKNRAKHIFILSTTLVYDRSEPNKLPLTEEHPLSAPGLLGGYVDNKLTLEKFWQKKKGINWTILRPYHIIGPGSYLGCLPDHNRDPQLLSLIKNDKPLTLCNQGYIKINVIDTQDIACIIFKAAHNPKTFYQAYNILNPTPITARQYYEHIGKLLDKQVKIINKPIQQIWQESKGWELTTLPHLYSTDKLNKHIGFIPNISLEDSLKRAIKSISMQAEKLERTPVHIRMTKLPRPKKIKWLLT